MLKILQARLQQYVNKELPDVQAGFRKGRGTRDQIANIHCIIEKARKFKKTIYFCFIEYTKAFDCMDHNKLENFSRDRNQFSSVSQSCPTICDPMDSSTPGFPVHHQLPGHNSKALILWLSAFLIIQLSHPYMTNGKTTALTKQTFVDKLMSQLFHILSSFS